MMQTASCPIDDAVNAYLSVSRQNTQQTVLHTSTQGHSLAGFRIRASVGTGGTIVTGEDKKRWRSSSKFFAKMEQLFFSDGAKATSGVPLLLSVTSATAIHGMPSVALRI